MRTPKESSTSHSGSTPYWSSASTASSPKAPCDILPSRRRSSPRQSSATTSTIALRGSNMARQSWNQDSYSHDTRNTQHWIANGSDEFSFQNQMNDFTLNGTSLVEHAMPTASQPGPWTRVLSSSMDIPATTVSSSAINMPSYVSNYSGMRYSSDNVCIADTEYHMPLGVSPPYSLESGFAGDVVLATDFINYNTVSTAQSGSVAGSQDGGCPSSSMSHRYMSTTLHTSPMDQAFDDAQNCNYVSYVDFPDGSNSSGSSPSPPILPQEDFSSRYTQGDGSFSPLGIDGAQLCFESNSCEMFMDNECTVNSTPGFASSQYLDNTNWTVQDPTQHGFVIETPRHLYSQRRPSAEGESNTARNHEAYQLGPREDGLYHCPIDLCSHKPEKLKCNYDKHLDSHLKPYRCKLMACGEISFSSTACLLRHEREAHGMHGHGEKPFKCHYENCDRATLGNGFPRRWNLQDHMKRVHNYTGELSGKGASTRDYQSCESVEYNTTVPARKRRTIQTPTAANKKPKTAPASTSKGSTRGSRQKSSTTKRTDEQQLPSMDSESYRDYSSRRVKVAVKQHARS